MADLLKVFVKKEIQNQLNKSYSHVRYPMAMYAQIIKRKEIDTKYIYVIRLLDKDKSVDSRFPEVPFVQSEMKFEKGEVVVVILLYGECKPFIIGRYIE